MPKAITRVGDAIAGAVGVHVAGSPNVFCNGKPVCRQGDAVVSPVCGGGVCVSFSPTVVVNNIPLHRVGDTVIYSLCGGTSIQGSPTASAD